MKRFIIVAVVCWGLLLIPVGAQKGIADSGATGTTASVPVAPGVSSGKVHTVDASRGAFSVEPPAGFNVLTASSAELACYGFPARPQGGPQLQKWENLMRGAAKYVVPSFSNPGVTLMQGGSVCGSLCDHATHDNPPDYPWSGYAMAQSRNNWPGLSWTQVNGEWNVPYGHVYCQSGPRGADAIVWAGLGGDVWDNGQASLIQAGTQTINHYPAPQTTYFWEDYPGQPVPVGGLSIS